MTGLPKFVHISEEGPREGFQIEKAEIPTRRKIELIDALSLTGLTRIQIVSFVDPRRVPGMADAEGVVAGITPGASVTYTGLWLNDRGFERALAAGRLELEGSIDLAASEKFLQSNQNRTLGQQIDAQGKSLDLYKRHGVPVKRALIMAAFGCNFEGDIAVDRVIELTRRILEMAAAHGVEIERLTLADTMGWATPLHIRRAVGELREVFPDLGLALHLHDTRGMGLANAYAGLEMGIAHFDSSVAGLGGCPFAGHSGAAGNVCTEDLVLMCEEMGIATGIDLDALAECARLAEDIVGHPLPGAMKKGGSLKRLRRKIAAKN